MFFFYFNQGYVLKEEFRVGPDIRKEGHSIGKVAMCWFVYTDHFS